MFYDSFEFVETVIVSDSLLDDDTITTRGSLPEIGTVYGCGSLRNDGTFRDDGSSLNRNLSSMKVYVIEKIYKHTDTEGGRSLPLCVSCPWYFQ